MLPTVQKTLINLDWFGTCHPTTTNCISLNLLTTLPVVVGGSRSVVLQQLSAIMVLHACCWFHNSGNTHPSTHAFLPSVPKFVTSGSNRWRPWVIVDILCRRFHLRSRQRRQHTHTIEPLEREPTNKTVSVSCATKIRKSISLLTNRYSATIVFQVFLECLLECFLLVPPRTTVPLASFQAWRSIEVVRSIQP